MANKNVQVKKVVKKTPIQEVETEIFAEAANDDLASFDKKAKPTKTVAFPVNDYEHALLMKVAKMHERSLRYMCRKSIVKALEAELDLQ